MSVKIGFFTGARSEYGIAKPLIKSLLSDKDFDLCVFVNGMHLLKKFGHTVDEIKCDKIKTDSVIETYDESAREKVFEFTRSVKKIYGELKKYKLDAVMVTGDRLESYSAALAAHFLKIPVIHLGGGAITEGAVDDIYRYNITSLARMHLATSRPCRDRLVKLPNIDRKNVYFFGSTAVDAIMKFRKDPSRITAVFKNIRPGRFALVTFHPVTRAEEPIPGLMDAAITRILKKDCDILITYPNNDEGYKNILKVIDKWRRNKRVFVRRSLGAEGYYAALNDCLFVAGNSSSGIIEAPYFGKCALNIGTRQSGRDKDAGVTDVPADKKSLLKAIDAGFRNGWRAGRCGYVYGNGAAIPRIKKAMLKFLRNGR